MLHVNLGDGGCNLKIAECNLKDGGVVAEWSAEYFWGESCRVLRVFGWLG